MSLELGGKSPFIVFADADLDAAAAASMGAVWGASGQVCTCGDANPRPPVDLRRLGQPDRRCGRRTSRSDRRWIRRRRWVRCVSAAQLERIEKYVTIGQEEGAELVLGGHRVGERGFYHEPTVFTGVRNDMRIAQEEIFGPVMGILPFSTEEEAYRIANDVSFGLAAGVWTSDLDRSQRAAQGAEGRHRLDQHLSDGLSERALRRDEALRPWSSARRDLGRGDDHPQERVDGGPLMDHDALQLLQDRLDVADAIYRYASTIDTWDADGLRAVLADDLWAQYGNTDPVVGGDAVAEWIGGATADYIWQHHLLSVYHSEIDGDTATALVYHTSRQLPTDDPATITLLVGRYHLQLRRGPNGWQISRLVLELLWAAKERDDTGMLAVLGGHGPHPTTRR